MLLALPADRRRGCVRQLAAGGWRIAHCAELRGTLLLRPLKQEREICALCVQSWLGEMSGA